MISLKSFSTAMLSATNIQLSDIQMSMAIGEKYAKYLHSFIVETFNVQDFSCSDNGIVKKITLVVDNDNVIIEMQNQPLGSNSLTVSMHNKTFCETYSSFEDFRKSLKQIKLLC